MLTLDEAAILRDARAWVEKVRAAVTPQNEGQVMKRLSSLASCCWPC